jgi:hypothetical protein
VRMIRCRPMEGSRAHGERRRCRFRLLVHSFASIRRPRCPSIAILSGAPQTLGATREEPPAVTETPYCNGNTTRAENQRRYILCGRRDGSRRFLSGGYARRLNMVHFDAGARRVDGRRIEAEMRKKPRTEPRQLTGPRATQRAP